LSPGSGRGIRRHHAWRRPLAAANAAEAVREQGLGGDLNALFRRADAALYVAKRAGRNRVEMLGPDEANPLTEVEAAVRAARRASLPDFDETFTAKLRA
jgi:predicted signal transduction protein with EAL and GGDEF domain